MKMQKKNKAVSATCYDSKCDVTELWQKETFRNYGDIIVIVGYTYCMEHSPS
jgi:hypothetical protein